MRKQVNNMSLQSLQEEALEKESLQLTVFNPTHKDLTISYNGVPYLIKKGEKVITDYNIGLHMAKHIANAVLESQEKQMTEENRQLVMGTIIL